MQGRDELVRPLRHGVHHAEQAPAERGEGVGHVDVANAVELGPDGFATSLRYPGSSLAEELQRALPAEP